MSIKTATLEQAYFHIQNSGYTFKIKHFNDPAQTGDSYQYSLGLTIDIMGSCTNITFPLGSTAMVDYLIEALQRTRSHMKKHKFKSDYAFCDFSDEKAAPPLLEIVGGKKIKQKKNKNTKSYEDDDGAE